MKDKILQLIENTDWVKSEDQENIKYLQFKNGKEIVNVYWGTMTVVINGSMDLKPRIIRNCNLEAVRIILGVRTSFVGKFKNYMRNLGI